MLWMFCIDAHLCFCYVCRLLVGWGVELGMVDATGLLS